MNELLLNPDSLFQLDLQRFLFGLIFVLFNVYLLKVSYDKYVMSYDNKAHLLNHIMPFALAIFVIVSVIKTSLALSLGLVGALSIIRFRTAIKEPGQIILLLVVTAISLSAAAEKEIVAVLLTAFYFLNVITRSSRKQGEALDVSSGLRIAVTEDRISVSKLINAKGFKRLMKVDNHVSVEFRNLDKNEILFILDEFGNAIIEYEVF